MSEIRPLRTMHDLPPKWDGRDVEWRGWSTGTTTMALHHPKERCGQCGSKREPSVNAGIMGPVEGEMVEHTPLKLTKSGRQYYGRTVLMPARRWVRIVAFRCPDCGNDEVWDKDTDEWWELDETDYGDEGSVNPRLF